MLAPARHGGTEVLTKQFWLCVTACHGARFKLFDSSTTQQEIMQCCGTVARYLLGAAAL
ncbi:hypothetical protein D917_05989 [Trichinella nativa]|uniref:Uncharacterized protein n=1 Tax=Trichinella nativa TaxID=6335 RepID=A0A1Y3EZA2_9BILA|nr:hypothetical protein D917_05989 [Trichinella nativa]